MSKRATRMTFRQHLISSAPPRPSGWACDDEYEVDEPKLSKYHEELCLWKSNYDFDREMSRIDAVWGSKPLEFLIDKPRWIQDKLEAAHKAIAERDRIKALRREWDANRSAWLDAKWRCYWADTVVKVEASA